ncbi:MAG: O-antigen ligase family protein [Bacteroidales bacterium]|nr:O-antigen ligase family protein [Bacteroidales bacterium]
MKYQKTHDTPHNPLSNRRGGKGVRLGLLLALLLTAVFIAAEAVVMYWKGPGLIALVPLALLVVWLFYVRLETGLLLMALLTPFAVNVAVFPGMELSMPVEPMMILFSAFFLFRVLVSQGSGVHSSLFTHPVTLLLLAGLAWWVVTSCTSRLPWVSFKYLLSRLWFVIPFYFAAALFFRNRERIRQFYWAYAIGLGVVILIATAKTLGNFSDLQTLHRVMRPFYNDHTAYGCAIALMLPACIYFLSVKWKVESGKLPGAAANLSTFIFPLLMLLLLCVGLFFSYCRAAWISVVAALGIYLLIRLGMKVKWMVLLFGLGVGMFFVYQSDVLYRLGKNHQDSSYTLADQVKSISNISTDASNVERLNRWASAMRLWKESPVVGVGPGTYQFLYGSYQKSYQLSTISTNAGDLGNAHSEYIGPMTEQGLPGALLVVALFLTTFATGVRVYRTAKDPAVGRMALAFTLSLLTYYVHGVFNNFLDTDKLSVPFWAFTAAVVALDLYSEKKEER